MRRLSNLAIITFLVLIFIGCDDKDSKKTILEDSNTTTLDTKDAVLTENYARLFTLNLTDGSTVNMQKTDKGFNIENNNTASLFIFFNTWCPPCKVEIPILNNIQDKFKNQLNIVGVLIEDKPLVEINEFISTNKIKYKIAYGQENNFFANALNGIVGVPYMVLYYPNGDFANQYLGIVPEEILENDIKRMLL